MRQAGGVIAIIFGIFGTVAALFTLLVGGIGIAFSAEDADNVVWLGFGGLVFSFLTIILGAICMFVASRIPGILLIVSAIAGAILGGTLVAVLMIFTAIGGILTLFDKSSRHLSEAPLPQSPGPRPNAQGMQVNCNNCGRQSSQGAQFCSGCGMALRP